MCPLFLTASLYRARASLHFPVNQGARCFAQRLGFVGGRVEVTWSTPAVVASAIRNSSTLVERSLLSSAYVVMISVNAAAKSYVDMWAFHLCAHALYSFRNSPSIHL